MLIGALIRPDNSAHLILSTDVHLITCSAFTSVVYNWDRHISRSETAANTFTCYVVYNVIFIIIIITRWYQRDHECWLLATSAPSHLQGRIYLNFIKICDFLEFYSSHKNIISLDTSSTLGPKWRLQEYSGLSKMADILQKTFSSVFSWMQNFDIWMKFHWTMFVWI